MKKFIIPFLFFISCENKYKSEEASKHEQEKSVEKKDKTVNIDGEVYDISGEINLDLQK